MLTAERYSSQPPDPKSKPRGVHAGKSGPKVNPEALNLEAYWAFQHIVGTCPNPQASPRIVAPKVHAPIAGSPAPEPQIYPNVPALNSSIPKSPPIFQPRPIF